MTDVFLKLVNMSIAAGWLILAVILMRGILKKAPKWVRRILWGLVMIRLICPVFPESGLSLMPGAEQVPEVVLARNAVYLTSGTTSVWNRSEFIGGHYYQGIHPVAGTGYQPVIFDTVTVLGWIWVAGMLTCTVWAAAAWIRLRIRVREAVCVWKDIWICDAVTSPFVCGIFRPRIYLPSGIKEAQAGHVIAHERAHIRKKDHLWKLFAHILLIVYWFHPLVWVAYILFCRDLEMECDETVIRDLDKDSRIAYSRALLACGMQRRAVFSGSLAFGEVSVKKRIRDVLRYKKPSVWLSIAAAMVCAGVGVFFLTNPSANQETVEPGKVTISEKNFVYTEMEQEPDFPTYDQMVEGELCPVCKKGHIRLSTTWGGWIVTGSKPCIHSRLSETGWKDVTYCQKGVRTKICDVCQIGAGDQTEEIRQECTDKYLY